VCMKLRGDQSLCCNNSPPVHPTAYSYIQVIFNGNGYDEEYLAKLPEFGVCSITSNVEAIAKYTDEKNIALFERMGVFSDEECRARQSVMYTHYVGVVEIEVSASVSVRVCSALCARTTRVLGVVALFCVMSCIASLTFGRLVSLTPTV
jgi:glutamine synthetase type III